MWLDVHLSCLFAKVNWSKAKDIAQERRETVFFPFVCVFSRKTQKKNVCVRIKHMSV